MKKLILPLFILTIIFLLPITANAHDYENPHKCGYSYGYDSESKYSTDWDIYETEDKTIDGRITRIVGPHWSNYEETITVSHGNFEEEHDFYDYITEAVNTWDSQTFNGSKLLSMEIDDDEGSVVFLNKTDQEFVDGKQKSSSWGMVMFNIAWKNKKLDENGHYLQEPGSIEIWIGWGKLKKSAGSGTAKYKQNLTHTALHELGHIIGLKDIANPNSLMYNVGSAPTTITLADKQGAAVISGQHKDHDFNYPEKEITETTHDKVCTICGVYKEKEAHKWDLISWTKCTECGHARDAAPPREIAVVNRNGVPIKGVSVSRTSETRPPTSNSTDENGILSTNWFDASYTLKLQHGNYKPKTIDNVEVKDGNASIEGQALAVIVMELLDQIRVVDTDGNPIKNARVDFTGHGGRTVSVYSGELGFVEGLADSGNGIKSRFLKYEPTKILPDSK
ncbi:MAG: matrixin family metalloprotease [Oscillospiraceae bacterium]|nr:matrixin family metalloprotease [Oscillospiraceae bacterium]